MAKIRLVPSTYGVSNSSYVTVSDVSNMYNNTDNETYATFQHTMAASTVLSVYIRGFDFSQIPDNAVINSFTVKVKVRESGASTSTTYIPRAVSGTNMYSTLNASGTVGTTAKVITFSGTMTFESMKNAGGNFGIRLQIRRNSTNTAAYYYVYGAEIEVDYDVPSEGGLSVKQDGEWKKVSKVYKKISGTWVEQEDIESLFDVNTKYINGGNV